MNTTESGKFWLTHPSPPKLSDTVKVAREVFHVVIKFMQDFEMSDLEAVFHEAAKPFLPYLLGDDFPSGLKDCPDLSAEFGIERVTQNIINLNDAHAGKWLK